MNRKFTRYLAIVMTLTITCVLAFSASAQQVSMSNEALTKSPNGIYIVQMKDLPVVAYAGGVKGLKATKPNKGKKINPNSPAVVKYADYLSAQHSNALRKVGGKKVQSFKYAFNGFSAKMSFAQANKMKSIDGVLSVQADELRTLETATTPDFLGLTAPGGLWDIGVKGEDVIIGIVDGGVWPESLSFTDRTGLNGNGKKDGKLDYQQIPG